MKQPTKKPLKKPVSKRMKRFDEGGYTGDDPIVKYRMGQLSEADTYDAMGQKDLANASRAKEPKVAPAAPKARTDNFYDTSSEKEIADASFPKARAEETVKATPVKTVTVPKTNLGPTTAQRNMLKKRDDVDDYYEAPKSKTIPKKTVDLKNGPIDLPPMIKSSLNDSESYDKTMKTIEKEKADKEKEKADKPAPFGSEKAGKQMKEDEDRLLAKLKNTSVEDVVGAGLSLLPIGRAAGMLKKGVGALKTIKPSQLGYDKKPSPAQLGYKKDPNPPVPKSIKEVTKNEKMDAKREQAYREAAMGMKKGGKVKTFKQGGKVSSASSRADGCAIRGKTRA